MAANKSGSKESRELPISRVRTIMKSSPDVENIGQGALYLVTRATEIFIQEFSRTAWKLSPDKQNLDYKQLAEVVQTNENMAFLREILPRKITVREYRQIMKSKLQNSEDEEEDEDEYDEDEKEEEDEEEENT